MALHLLDSEVVADLHTYVARALRLDPDGAIRLQATGPTLAAWVGVRKGRGLSGEGTVVGLRVMPLSPESQDVDVVVELKAVADRLARMTSNHSTVLDIPPVTVRTSWAAISPPRAGWTPLGTVGVERLQAAAKDGITEVATGAGDQAGAVAVEKLQQLVWGRAIHGVDPSVDGLAAGAALGLVALGFDVGDEAQVFATARWHRVSTPAGHVLVR